MPASTPSSPPTTPICKRYDISQLDRLVNDLFVEDITGRSRFAVTGYFFQGLRATDNSRALFPSCCR